MACRLRMLRAFCSVGLGCNSMLTSADTAWYWCHLLCRSVSLAGHIPNVYEHLITSYMEWHRSAIERRAGTQLHAHLSKHCRTLVYPLCRA